MRHPLTIDLHTVKYTITINSNEDEENWIESIVDDSGTQVSYTDLLVSLAKETEQEFDVAED